MLTIVMFQYTPLAKPVVLLFRHSLAFLIPKPPSFWFSKDALVEHYSPKQLQVLLDGS